MPENNLPEVTFFVTIEKLEPLALQKLAIALDVLRMEFVINLTWANSLKEPLDNYRVIIGDTWWSTTNAFATISISYFGTMSLLTRDSVIIFLNHHLHFLQSKAVVREVV